MSEFPDPLSNRAPKEGALGFIFVTLLIDVLGFGLVIPIIPALIQQLNHSSAGIAAPVYGYLLASYGLMQFLFAPVLGNLSDQVGRRPVLLASLGCNGFDYIVMALSPSIGWLFLGRIISGIAGASFTAATAYIADISPPEKRAQNFGVMGAAFGIGFIVGPAVGGLLGSINPRLPFWLAAGLSVANCIYGYFLVPESLALENRRPFRWSGANPIGSMKLLGRYRGTLLLALVSLFLSLAQQSLQSTWVLFTTYRFSWTPWQNGLALGLVGLISGGVQAGLSRIIIPKLGEPTSMVIGLMINCVGYFLFGASVGSAMILGTLVFWCLGGIAGPALQSMVSKAFGADEQGAVQGALTSIQSITGIVGPIAATNLFNFFTSRRAPVQVPGASFFYGGVLVFAAILLALAAIKQPEIIAEPSAA